MNLNDIQVTALIIGMIISWGVSIFGLKIALKKTPHEIKNIDANAVATFSESAEKAANLAKQYYNQILAEREDHKKNLDEMQKKIKEIQKEQEENRMKIIALSHIQQEMDIYVEYLLNGISKLTAQLTLLDVQPIWTPKSKDELMKEKKS